MDFLNLISKAKAQGADTLSAPTFAYTPPGGTVPNNNTTTTTTDLAIKLETTTSAVKVGEKIKVRIAIDTQSSKITGFATVISFDPDYFQVVDADEITEGIQIDYIDTVFSEQTNTASNSNGIITLRAADSDSASSAVSRTVAEIELIATKTGTSELKIVKQSSNLIGTSGVDILETTNSINFNISAQSTTVSPTDENSQFIPKTGIQDYTGVLIGVIAGIFLIVIGFYLKIVSKGGKKSK